MSIRLTELAISDLVSSILEIPKSPSLMRFDLVRKIFRVFMSLKRIIHISLLNTVV